MDSTNSAIRLRAVLAVATVSCLLIIPTDCFAKRPHVDDSLLPTLGVVVSVPDLNTKTFDRADKRWSTSLFNPVPSAYIRLRLYIRGDLQGQRLRFVVSDPKGKDVDFIDASEFYGKSSIKYAWTKRIFDRAADVRLESEAEPTGLEVGIDQYIYQFHMPADQNFIGGRDDREDLFLAYGRNSSFYRWGKPVAELAFVSKDTQKETNCTSFLVSRTLLLTNAHCVSESWQIRTASAVFGFETQTAAQETFQIKEIVAKSASLDFTLLRIEGDAAAWGAVSFQGSRKVNEPLILIQQPNGGPKIVAVRKCLVQKVLALGLSGKTTDFYHLCDTEGGSSGSPVMDADSGAVIGIHHGGQWDPSAHDFHNLAVRSELLLSNLALCAPSACNEIEYCSRLYGGKTFEGPTVCND